MERITDVGLLSKVSRSSIMWSNIHFLNSYPPARARTDFRPQVAGHLQKPRTVGHGVVVIDRVHRTDDDFLLCHRSSLPQVQPGNPDPMEVHNIAVGMQFRELAPVYR